MEHTRRCENDFNVQALMAAALPALSARPSFIPGVQVIITPPCIFISLVIIDRKYTRRYQNDFTL